MSNIRKSDPLRPILALISQPNAENEITRVAPIQSANPQSVNKTTPFEWRTLVAGDEQPCRPCGKST